MRGARSLRPHHGFATVYQAEVIAHRIGELFRSLALALAVTIIEVALMGGAPRSLERVMNGLRTTMYVLRFT
jgi:hypothetical protein